MKFTIRGIQHINRTKQDGTQVIGLNLYLSRPMKDVIGEAVQSEYVSGNSEAYAVIRPYLANNVDRLINAACNVDFDVRQYGDKATKIVAGFELIDKQQK